MDDEPEISDDSDSGWVTKFVNAAAGIVTAFRTESSFYIHLPIALAVVLLAIFLRVTAVELSILLLCIALVLVAELLNTAVESLARAITEDFDRDIQKALDVAAGGVLVASILAGLVGLIIFGNRIFDLWMATSNG